MVSKDFSPTEKNHILLFTGLSRGHYRLLGMMFSVCIVHGGLGPRVLSKRLFSQLSGLPAPPVDITEVDEPELRAQLEKVTFNIYFV